MHSYMLMDQANDLANGIKNKLFAFLLGVYAHPELKGMLTRLAWISDTMPASLLAQYSLRES